MDFDIKNFIEVTKDVIKACTTLGLFTRITEFFSKPKHASVLDQPQRRKSDLIPPENRLPLQCYDRRQGSLEDRLKDDIWTEFHRKTGYGKNQLIATWERGNLARAFVAAGLKYQFLERGSDTLLRASTIAKPAADSAWATWERLAPTDRMPIILVEEFTNYILLNFNVVTRDRRQGHQTMAG